MSQSVRWLFADPTPQPAPIPAALQTGSLLITDRPFHLQALRVDAECAKLLERNAIVMKGAYLVMQVLQALPGSHLYIHAGGWQASEALS